MRLSSTTIKAKQVNCCGNCDSVLVGSYCHECGQKHIDGRLSTGDLFVQFFEALTNFDGTLWQTLKKLIRNPGSVALEYIEGGRAKYLNPIRFFLVTFTMYLGLMTLSGAQFNIASRNFAPIETEIPGFDAQMFNNIFSNIVSSQLNLVILAVIPLLVFFIRWQYWYSGRNYAETFTFICFVFGLGFLYGLIFVPALYITETYTHIPKNLITFILFIIGSKTFFDITWLKAIGAGLLSALLYFLTIPIVTSIVAVLITYALTF